MTTAQKQSTPVLRFKDEQGEDYPDWEEKQFSSIAEKVNSLHNPASDKNNYVCIELDSLSSDTGQLLKIFDSSKQKSIKTRFRAGDVLYGKLRPYLRKFYLAQFDGVCTSEIWVLRHVSVSGAYLYQLVQSHLFTGKRPLPVDVIRIMDEQPRLRERRVIGERIIGRIVSHVDTFIDGMD